MCIRDRLTSAQNHHAIKELIQRIEKLRKGRDVYVVGVTNVGKSTLIKDVYKRQTLKKALSSGEVITIKLVASPLKNSSKGPAGYIGWELRF